MVLLETRPGVCQGPPEPPGPTVVHRRRWPWIVAAVVLLAGAGVGVLWLTANRAVPVTMRQAESRMGMSGGRVTDTARPAPGVYLYTGSGMDHLSLPPLSQAEGPTMPGTVTLLKNNCWDFRIDYSSHHWQTWDYCLHGGNLSETGGRLWQLWSIGPVGISNWTSIRCSPPAMAAPAGAAPGASWPSRCTGTSSAVKGTMTSAGPYRFEGNVTLRVGGKPVQAARFLERRTDSGAQRGTERTELWLDERNGLPIRVRQDIKVVTATPFGTSTYTQSGVFALQSLVAHR